MIQDKIARRVIQDYLDKGIFGFAIYPYGDNGVKVKNILEECFDIKPVYVIDNNLKKYNKNIISFDTFKKEYTNDICVILTIENWKLNTDMEDALRKFVGCDMIINLLYMQQQALTSVVDEREVTDQFVLSNILPQTQLKTRKQRRDSNKIKVRIMWTSFVFWNSIKTICEAFEGDSRFDVAIVMETFEASNKELMEELLKEEKHQYILWKDYNAEEDEPDIFILTFPTGQEAFTKAQKIREYAKLIVIPAFSLINYSNSLAEFWKMLDSGWERFHPDYYLFDSLLYKELEEYGYRKKQLIEMGNAKYDGIFEACKNKSYPEEWQKLKGKTTILWTTTHGIYNNKISDDITFDLYASAIFKYAAEHTEMGFIFRPHSSFINELLRYGYWEQNDLESMREYCKKSPNVILDESVSYDVAFSIADAVLTDAFCGIICSALPTLKPICVMYRNDIKHRSYDIELLENYYSVHNANDMVNFFEMIKNGKDDMYELRRQASHKYVKHFDGKNGQRIKEFIEEKYFELDS